MKKKGAEFQFLGYRQARIKTQARRSAPKWLDLFSRQRMNDPMLVLNMSIFNFADGWNRTFSPLKVHENGAR